MNKPDDMLIIDNLIYPFLEPGAPKDEIRLAGKMIVETNPNLDEPFIRFGLGFFYLNADDARRLIAGLQYALSVIESTESAADAD